MSKKYILNLETSKIELHFTREEYNAVPPEQKKELKRNFIWSGNRNAWVSKSTQNHYSAIQTANMLGFIELEKQGERLSYAEQLQRKAERAENRIDRYIKYADNAEKRGDSLQAELNSFRGDVAFFTQPNINSSGGRAFTNYRNRVYQKYERGFDEYRKSEYFKGKATTAQATADMQQLKNPVYLNNRIEECNANIRRLERYIIEAENLGHTRRVENLLEKIDIEGDKLGFFENCMDELKNRLKEDNKKIYTKDDIKPGYLIRTRFSNWALVKRVNTKTVTAVYQGHPLDGLSCQPAYAEIREIKIPDGWTGIQDIENPFKIGDILTRNAIGGRTILHAYQVVTSSKKTILIQQIKVDNNKPVLNSFIANKQERKTVKQDRNNNYVVNDSYGDWYLYKYIQNEEKGA